MVVHVLHDLEGFPTSPTWGTASLTSSEQNGLPWVPPAQGTQVGSCLASQWHFDIYLSHQVHQRCQNVMTGKRSDEWDQLGLNICQVPEWPTQETSPPSPQGHQWVTHGLGKRSLSPPVSLIQGL